MRDEGSPLFTRRHALLLAGSGLAAWLPVYGSSAEFWNKKAPAEWTPEEIDKLITKSPWAKEVTAEYAAGGEGGTSGSGAPGGSIPGTGRTGTGGGIGGLSIPGIGGIGGRRGRGGGGRGPRGGMSHYEGIVRWESAKPVIEAMKSPLPEAFAGHYVISVNSIPWNSRGSGSANEDESQDASRRSRQDDLENLKELASLQSKGKDLVQAGIVQQQVGSGTSFLFGFSKELLPLSADDKEILFSSRFGRLLVKAKFHPKEMLYQGQLAL